MAHFNRTDTGYKNFLKALATQESSNDVDIINPAGYVGLYQMGQAALYDIGYYRGDGNLYDKYWTGYFTGKNGVDNLNEFRYSAAMQTEAVYLYHNKLVDYMKGQLDHSIQSYIGKSVDGVKITLSGLIAGAHLVGAGGLAKYLDDGTNVYDGNGVHVKTYIKKFSGYTIDWNGGTDGGSGGGGSTNINNTLYGNSSDNTIHGWDGNDKIYGYSGNDKLYGDNHNDSVYGGYGNDYVNGGAGNDLVSGQEGNDTVVGWSGNDKVYGGSGNDYLYGNSGNDQLYGWTGNDVLSGGSGRDYIDGGDGNDKMWGGSGSDTFRFAPGSDYDIIYDFDPTSTGDVINITGHRSVTSKYDLFQNHIYDSGNNVVINLLGGDILVLANMSESRLDYADFII